MTRPAQEPSSAQGTLFALLAAPPVPDLAGDDVILINISGGKDSQAVLDETVRAADAAGVRDRIVTVFCDLGDEDEWPGTRELAAEHAAHYGLRHEVVRREITTPSGQRVQQTLTDHIEQRGKWPDAARRYCTSDLKRAPVHRLMTRLAAEQRAAGITGRRVRILNVLGLRAQESAKRALMTPFSRDERATNQTVRLVDEWLPSTPGLCSRYGRGSPRQAPARTPSTRRGCPGGRRPPPHPKNASRSSICCATAPRRMSPGRSWRACCRPRTRSARPHTSRDGASGTSTTSRRSRAWPDGSGTPK